MSNATDKSEYSTSICMPKRGFRVITVKEEVAQKLEELRKQIEAREGRQISYNTLLRIIVKQIDEKLAKARECEQ